MFFILYFNFVILIFIILFYKKKNMYVTEPWTEMYKIVIKCTTHECASYGCRKTLRYFS